MVFSSFEYLLLFLPITAVVYFYLNSKRLVYASKAWMVLCSLFFYCWWNVKYLPLILLSILFNYSIGTGLARRAAGPGGKNVTLLVIGILGNLVLLGYYKYAGFFSINLDYLFNLDLFVVNIALPLGISFFTFTQIAYLVDTYN